MFKLKIILFLFSTYAHASWWHELIQLREAMDYVRIHPESFRLQDNPAPIIAVLDSGIDVVHPSIQSAILEVPHAGSHKCGFDRFGCNTSILTFRGTFGDGRVFPHGLTSFDTQCNGVLVPKGSCLHATHVAAIIAGSWESSTPGICPFCRILNIKVVSEKKGTSFVYDSSIVKALMYIDHLNTKEGLNIQIVNSSFGKFQRSRSITHYLNQLKAKGREILWVGAAGNEESVFPVYPAAEDLAIAVGSVNSLALKSSYTNSGPWVEIYAPGGDAPRDTIFSAAPGGLKFPSQGTSMSAPMVTGVAGLLKYLKPDLSPSDLKSILISTTDHGILNTLEAVKAIHQSITPAQTQIKWQVNEHSCGVIGKTSFQSLNWLFLILPLVLLLIKF